MQSETSTSRAASAGPSFANHSGASAPGFLPNSGYNSSLNHTLLQSGFAQQQQQQQQNFAQDLSFSNGRSFQHVSQDSSHNEQFRTQSVPRAINYPSYTAVDAAQHLQQQQASFHSLGYPTQHNAPTSYPFATYTSDFAGPSYTTEYGAMASSSVPMMRYGSYATSAEDMSRSGSSQSAQVPMTQQDIDNLLAMSRAQAKNLCDATAFPCTYCDKVYTGKHARSIWRRHLQDKHNIPLSAQPRRTRWDGDANRPKNAQERRDRMLESKRRWARKKRLQEKQAAQGENGTPFDEDDSRWDDESADADVSNMSASFAGANGADDTFSTQDVKPSVLADKRNVADVAPVRIKQEHEWDNEASNFFLPQGHQSKAMSSGPLKDNSNAPIAAHNLYTSTFPSDRRAAPINVSMRPPQVAVAAGMNDSFSSNSSDNSQPGSASFFNDSFGRISNSGSESANTSISTPTSAGLPLLEPIEKLGADVKVLPPKQKKDTREAAIQLLALRSNSNSPSDNREVSRRNSPSQDGEHQWASTPSRAVKLERSEHAALSALSRPAPSPRSASMNNLHDARRGQRGLMEGASLSQASGSTGRRLSDARAPGETSPTPASRTLAAGSAAVRSATSGTSAIPFATPGPATRVAENPFSLDKHKISPYEGRRKLSYSGSQGSPIASPTNQAFGATVMDRSLSSSAVLGRSSMGPKLPPLVSTPVRSGNADGGSQNARNDGEKVKFESLPPLVTSTDTKAAANVMATPFSKGFSAMRRPGTNAPGSTIRPSPSRHLLDDQFSSPQHLNLTESLGLAPHSSSRTSSSYSNFYASSLGLTPSVAGMSGVMMGTPFHSAIGGGLSSLGGFTPLSTHKVGGGGMGFWPDSLRKSGTFAGSFQTSGSPSVFPSFTKSASQPNPVEAARVSQSGPMSSGGRKRKAGSGADARKADIFDADLVRSGQQPTSDDAFGDLHDDDDDDDENMMSIQALDTPSRPAPLRKLPRTTSTASKRGSVSPRKLPTDATKERPALQTISTNTPV